MNTAQDQRHDICEAGQRLWEHGYVASNDGNISIRISQNEILTTPTGVSKGFMTPEMLCVVDAEGNLLEGTLNPSSELPMHLAIYHARPEVRAVVHAHPPISTGFAVSGSPLRSCALPEAMVSLGSIAVVPYATPSAGEIPAAMAPYLMRHDAFLLTSHGAVTIGADLWQAYYRMETLEHFAKVISVARSLGGERLLSREQIEKLQAIRKRMGLSPVCDTCNPCKLT